MGLVKVEKTALLFSASAFGLLVAALTGHTSLATQTAVLFNGFILGYLLTILRG